MSTCLKKNAQMLGVLAHAPPQMCKAIIGAADRELMTCLCECAQNILNGNVPLTKSHLKHLQWYRSDICTLAKKRALNIRKRKFYRKEDFYLLYLHP